MWRYGAVLLVVCTLVPAAAAADPVFTHGVAAGYPDHQSAVLWTRVDSAARLTVEVSPDPSFAGLLHIRKAEASADTDYTVQAVVNGLRAGTTYWYRWRAGGATSETGRFETAPRPDRSVPLRLAWTGDSDGTHLGGVPVFDFSALNAIRDGSPDVFLYLGDTVYADFRAGGAPGIPPAVTLDEYRALYKEARSIAPLPALLASTGTITIWDDHEVRDDFAGQTVDPVLFANGRRAFLEYQPIAAGRFPTEGCAADPFYRTLHWGKDVDLFVLDERSCRSAEVAAACFGDLAPTLPTGLRAFFGGFLPLAPPPGCVDAIDDPSRTMLGPEQKRRFLHDLEHSKASWKIVVNEVAISQNWALPYDRWEGYGAERSEVLETIRDRGIRGVVFLTTDEHRNLVSPVYVDRFGGQPPVAWEFVTGPIGTATYQQLVLGLFGPVFGPFAVAAQHSLLSIAGVGCRHLNAFSYGELRIDGGTAEVTLRDATGAVIHDQLNPAIACTKTLTP